MKFNFFPLILFASILVVATSCNRDHDGFEERIVMIDANGNVSNGARFVGIDESNFYINDIKYSVVGGHLEVTGYDKGFSGTAEIFSGVAYHSNNYRVLAIANGAFSGCEALKAVSFPDGITSIGARAFSGCISLLKVNIPASVTVLGNGAFEYCSNIVEVSLGSEMKSIGDGAFSGCEALKAVSLPDGITSIGDQAFSGCISLLKVNVPASVTVLGDGAFEYCSNMVEVSLGSEVKSIGDGAFRGCQSLEGIHIGNQDPPQLGESCFMDSGGCPIYVPDESIKKYLSDGSWQVYRKRIYGEKSKKSAIDFKGIVVSVNGVEFSMIAVEGGTFLMGSPDDDVETYGNEKPQHQVTLSDYYIGETEVTQELWEAVMGSNPPYYDGYPQRPVVYVTWNDCQTFIQKLNALTGKKFRLPTEAEWEFAARGGKKSKGYKYSGSDNIDDVAWHRSNSGGSTHDVATKALNELGLYDMSGNVWEWCQDWYGSYSSQTQTNPTGPSSGSYRVVRGGCWDSYARDCRVSNRSDNPPSHWISIYVGFRLAL